MPRNAERYWEGRTFEIDSKADSVEKYLDVVGFWQGTESNKKGVIE